STECKTRLLNLSASYSPSRCCWRSSLRSAWCSIRVTGISPSHRSRPRLCRFSSMASWWRDRRASGPLQRLPEPARSRFRCCTFCSTKDSLIGSRFGYVRSWRRSLSIWLGCATCQAEDQQANGKGRQAYVVKNHAEARRGESDRKEHQCRAQKVECGGG